MDTEQNPLIDLLRFLPDDLKDGETDAIPDEKKDWPRRVTLNSWATARLGKREEITLELNNGGRGNYKKKLGQYNMAGIYKRVRKAKKDSDAEKAKEAKAISAGNAQRARLVPLFNSLCKQAEVEPDEEGVAWLDDERSFVAISALNDTDPAVVVQIDTVEIRLTSEAKDVYEFSYIDFPQLTLKEMKKTLKTLLEATIRQLTEAP